MGCLWCGAFFFPHAPLFPLSSTSRVDTNERGKDRMKIAITAHRDNVLSSKNNRCPKSTELLQPDIEVKLQPGTLPAKSLRRRRSAKN